MNGKINQSVIDRLLIAKNLLDKIRFLPLANPDRKTLAHHILISHDAAELAIAGIASYLDVTPKDQYLLRYFQPIAEKANDGKDVPGKSYMSQLNDVRVAIKHKGLFPDPKQWSRVGENTYRYISEWCSKYLNISFDDLDESLMISDPDVKNRYGIAKKALSNDDYKGVLENLASALYSLFTSNRALRNLKVGTPHAEDALKLAAFGVHANEFLVLQEFLPSVYYSLLDGKEHINWIQEKHDHPANWRQDAAEFCLKTFVSIALRIQDAEWIPGAVDFDTVYDHKITALFDDVEIFTDGSGGLLEPKKRVVVRSLKKGESLRGKVEKKDRFVDQLVALKLGQEYKSVLTFTNYEEMIIGKVEEDKIRVTCVPKDTELVRQHFAHLPELDYK
ncbi:MAG: hypothetical protein ABIE92_00575 [bacterium]